MTEDDQIDAIWRHFDFMFDTLTSDIELIEQHLTEQDQQAWRRSLYRAVFAMIEGINSWLKQTVIDLYWPGIIGDETKNALLDKEEYIDHAGEKKVRNRFKKFSDNLFFAFDSYAWTAGAPFTPNKNSSEWSKLHLVYAVRNRIVHPKSATDLEISDQELALLQAVKNWYTDQLMDLFRSAAKASFDQLERLMKRRRLRFPDEEEGLDEKEQELEEMRALLEKERRDEVDDEVL
jgi:hypothetical protein